MEATDVTNLKSADLSDYSYYLKYKLTPRECSNFYSTYARNYDKFMVDVLYRGPSIVAETVKSFYDDDTNIRILDMAAGTGILGQQLHALGFDHVDALEPCRDMLNNADSKGVYQNLYCEYLSEEKTSIADDTYDCLVMSGGLCTGHIPCQALAEMIRITKPGGLFVNIMQTWYLQNCDEYKKLEPFMVELEGQGKWRQLVRQIDPAYCRNKPGVLTVHEVLESGYQPFVSAVL